MGALWSLKDCRERRHSRLIVPRLLSVINGLKCDVGVTILLKTIKCWNTLTLIVSWNDNRSFSEDIFPGPTSAQTLTRNLEMIHKKALLLWFEVHCSSVYEGTWIVHFEGSSFPLPCIPSIPGELSSHGKLYIWSNRSGKPERSCWISWVSATEYCQHFWDWRKKKQITTSSGKQFLFHLFAQHCFLSFQ